MNSIVIIHGIGGIEKESYFPHLKQKCELLGLKVFMPSLGSYKENISYEKWKSYCDTNILPFIEPEKTIFVGQSIGTQFLIKYLVEKNLNILAYISCAGPFDVLKLKPTAPERAFSFSPTSELFKPSNKEFTAFSKMLFPKFSFFCDNDIFFEQSNLEKYAKTIKSKPIFIKGKGHFNFDAKVFEFNELEELIYNLNKE